jgi:hypothetical protein
MHPHRRCIVVIRRGDEEGVEGFDGEILGINRLVFNLDRHGLRESARRIDQPRVTGWLCHG